uniref:Hydrogenase maturation protein HypF n=1 Tax=uncultured beta proteobacterium TaxID=86027 RepID=H5SEY7_9PROT|nr:hydrogenase maturation protein HypF [uncultured beta proteobacterium]
MIAETVPETAGPWVGWSLDGLGWGKGGEAWGGELLQLDACGAWRRLDHFPLLALPGGDRAAREPWRLAVAVLARATGDEAVLREWWARRAAAAQALGIRWPHSAEVERLWHWLRSCPNGSIMTTSSVGRWFDAVSALLGLCAYNTFEGEAALRLESAAARAFDVRRAPSFVGRFATDGEPHWEPEANWHGWWSWVARFAAATAIPEWAAAFHHVIAETLVARARPHLTDPTLLGGGGCWQNRLLIDATAAACARYGVTLRLAQQLPANDGGIALGQAWWVLAARRAMTASQRSSREETSDVSGNTRRSGCAFA